MRTVRSTCVLLIVSTSFLLLIYQGEWSGWEGTPWDLKHASVRTHTCMPFWLKWGPRDSFLSHAAHRSFHFGAVGGGSAALAARTSRRRSLGDQCGESTELALCTVSLCGRTLGACGPLAGRAGGFLPRLRLLDELVVRGVLPSSSTRVLSPLPGLRRCPPRL